jgi:hypothetical protein
MSRRKWAWEAHYGSGEHRDVESATIADFLDDVFERIAEIEETAERTGNPAVLLGLALATDALREVGNQWEAL